MPRFYHRLGSVTPPQVAQMPLDALRSQLYPVHPDAANYQQTQAQLPIGLPQRMMFTRWKSGSAAVQWSANARGYVSARDFGDQHSGPIVTAAGVPPVLEPPAIAAAQRGATRLPQTPIDADINQIPLAKGYVPQGRFFTGAELSAMIDQSAVGRVMAAQTANVRQSRAINEISAVRSAIFDRLNPSDTPWYARR